MKVLQVNNVDLEGRRFNGYDLLSDLSNRGIHASQAVLTKSSHNPDVFSLLSREDSVVHDAISLVEDRHSMNNLLFPWGRVLAEHPEFLSADVVHYHLIHNQVISLLDLPRMFDLKPSIWTIHDPWILTGHCVHPLNCLGWMTGCNDCPHLDSVFPMSRDNASRMWRIKQRVLSDIDVDLVVASDFMLDMVKRSPLTAHLDRVHLIPFGIDSSTYLLEDQRSISRDKLGIPKDDFVILFRASDWGVKGLPYIIEALGSTPPLRSTTLLTVDKTGLVDALADSYNIVEMGWVDDEALHRSIYSASDVFVMASEAEAFGLMAVEAMAAGRPVVCFAGTAVSAVTHAPECGISVPFRDATALRAAIDFLSDHPAEVVRRGALGREIAASEYSHERYLKGLEALYRTLALQARS